MFTEYFGLTENPFNLATDFSVFFIDSYKKKICRQILADFQTDYQPILVTGPLGVGKTQFAHYLLIQTPADIKTTYFSYHYTSDIDKTQQLLVQLSELQKKNIFIIDNAHDLPIDELILILASSKNLPNIQLLLMGLPELHSKLTALDPDLYSPDQAHPYPLIGLTPQEVSDYIQFRLQHAGYETNKSPALFSAEALKELAALSYGMPHSINLLCGSSLLLTSIYEQDQVSEAIVQEASLNSLLPKNKFEHLKPTNILDFPVALPSSQINKPSLIKMRLRQTRFIDHRTKHLKRYALIHKPSVTAQLPILLTDHSSDTVTHPTPQRNQLQRLSKGVLAFCASLALLFGVQFISKPTQTLIIQQKPSAVAIDQASENAVQSVATHDQNPTIENSIRLQSPVAETYLTEYLKQPKAIQSNANPTHSSFSALSNQKIWAPNPETANVPETSPPLANRDKIQLDQKIDTTQINAHLLVQNGKVAKAASPAQEKLVKPIVEAQLDSDMTVKDINTLPATKAGRLKPKLSNSRPQLRQLTLQTLQKKPLDNVDPQEAAARDRASSKLDLARLGIEFGVEAFMQAAQTGNAYVLKLLISGGMPPDVKNNQGETALMIASRKGYKRVVNQLINAGARPEQRYQQSLIVGKGESDNGVTNF